MNDTVNRPPVEPRHPQRRSAGATAGIVLIVIGVVLLAAQFVPGIMWWSAWPLIIVFAGLVQAFTPGKSGWSVNRVFDGLVTVSIGLALLAWTTGLVGAGFLGRLISLWPVLIIALGFELLGKALHAEWMRAVGSLVVIGAIALAVGTSVAGLDGWPMSDAYRSRDVALSEPLGEVSEAMLTLKAGVASVRIGEGPHLVSVDGESPFGEPRLEVDRSGDKADVRLWLSGEGVMVPGVGSARLDATLSDEVLWDLIMETGVAELDADLSSLLVRSLELKPGVASCTVRLGKVPDGIDEAACDVRSGVSAVKILIPEGTGARVESESGLTGHSIRGDFRDSGNGIWETPGYEAGSGVWIIRVRSGIGSIDIDTY